MAKSKGEFVHSYGWWVEEDKAWFVEVKNNILFCVDLNTGICEEAVLIPDMNTKKYALTPVCMKYGREIWCIPGWGESIWVYHLDDKSFCSIDLDIYDKINATVFFSVQNNMLFIVPMWCNEVIEINIYAKKVENYYKICERDIVGPSITVGNSIFMMTYISDKVYEFDMATKMIKTHNLPDMGKIQNICFDGERFWLSGYKKEIYICDKSFHKMMVIKEFPNDFGVYDFTKETDGKVDCTADSYLFPTFPAAVAVGEYVWFIPGQTNRIIYADKGNYQLSAYEIDGEDETRESILLRSAGMDFKYGLEYIRDNRYIGLLSAKYNRIVEIDTRELSHQWKDYCFSDNCLEQCSNAYQGVYFEGDILQTQIYGTKLMNGTITRDIQANIVGTKIYLSSKNDLYRHK